MTSYVARLAAVTSWDHDFILWDLPFSEGMRILDYHVWTGDGTIPGKPLRWADDLIDLGI